MTINAQNKSLRSTASGVCVPISDGVFVSEVFRQTFNGNNFIQPSSIFYFGNGKHTGADAAANLTVSGAGWTTDEWVGMTVRNASDGLSAGGQGAGRMSIAEGIITSNTSDTPTATLSGGIRRTWDTGDRYELTATVAENDIIWYNPLTNLDGAVTIDQRGVAHIEGVSGAHSFNYYIEESGGTFTPTYTVTYNITESL